MTYYRRRRLDGRQKALSALVAAGAAIGTGVVVHYLARLFLARERLSGPSSGLPVRDVARDVAAVQGASPTSPAEGGS